MTTSARDSTTLSVQLASRFLRTSSASLSRPPPPPMLVVLWSAGRCLLTCRTACMRSSLECGLVREYVWGRTREEGRGGGLKTSQARAKTLTTVPGAVLQGQAGPVGSPRPARHNEAFVSEVGRTDMGVSKLSLIGKGFDLNKSIRHRCIISKASKRKKNTRA
ncbi:hypothetical protein ElyMa_000795400 [Elysia marginata]|uniref:Uncharacterized protein n=1 Tax=Elysia marginata TaxID=1093978 RepID=A0AAV4GYP0_9GAST|nr:hypothetical protein ElyMa_000795400 [Elysia marginata]